MRHLTRTKVIGAIVIVLIAAGLVSWRLTANRGGITFSADFASAKGLYPGSDVEILGVPVGHVTQVTPGKHHVRVRMELDSGQHAAAGTGAVVVAPTLVSDRYVQLTEPYDGGAEMKSGTLIPIDRTAVPVEIDQLYNNLTEVADTLGPNGINAHGALSKLLTVAAANLKGQGRNLHTTITEFGKAGNTLSGSDQDLFATVAHLQKFTGMLDANDAGVAHLNRQLANVSSYLAQDRHDMAAAINNLGGAMAMVKDFIKNNRAHLKSSVEKLRGPTEVLVRQKKSLAAAVRTIPLALQNYLNAYDPKYGTVDGRGDLNELTIWAGNGLSAKTSADAPPVLIPNVTGNSSGPGGGGS